jgi:AraC-like DNA-binding protein
MIESLANGLAIQLIRHLLRPRRLAGRTDGVLPRRKLDTVVEYIMENLEGNLTLEQMAALVHISPYHSAWAKSRYVSASMTKASSAFISSGSSASRRDSFGLPQESPQGNARFSKNLDAEIC